MATRMMNQQRPSVLGSDTDISDGMSEFHQYALP